MHDKETNKLYPSPNIIRVIKSRRIRWTGRVARVGKRKSANRILLGKPEGKRQLGRPRCKWKDHIKRDIQERIGHVLNLSDSG
jgi:hypothetical protein